MNNYTHTLLKSSQCDFISVDDYRKVVCKEHINVGDILLVEHCYYQKANDAYILRNSIRYDRDLFNSLYPRKIVWKDEYAVNNIPNEIDILIRDKLQNNLFKFDGDYIIGNDVSWFNHSNNPNTYAVCSEVDNELNLNCSIISIVAGKEINVQEEILISYGDTISFLGDKNTEKMIPFEKYEPHSITERIQPLIKQYLITPTYKGVMMKQICSYYGLYMIDDVISHTSRFIEYISNEIYYDKDNLLSSIAQWMKIMSEKISNLIVGKIRVAILIASHISYDNQLIYLTKCLDSLLNQTVKADIFCSMSFDNNNYHELFNQIIMRKYHNSVNMVFHGSKKSQFQHLLSLTKNVSLYDLLLFCDDDDIYDNHRVEIFSRYYDQILKQLPHNKIFGGLHEGTDTSTPGEFWKYAVPPSLLRKFFEKISGYDYMISNKFCDILFANYIRRLNTSYIFVYFDPKCELYHYNIHDESVTGRIQKSKHRCNLTRSPDDVRDQMFLLASQLHSIKDFKDFLSRCKIDRHQVNKIFREYNGYYTDLIYAFRNIYDLQ